MQRNQLVVLLLLFIVVLLSACGPALATATPPSTVPPTVPPPTETPVIAGRPAIVLEQSGGLQGLDERWSIYSDGRVESSTGQSLIVPAQQVRAAMNAIHELGFFDLQDSYGQSGTCNDCITNRITMTVGTVTKTVTAVDGASDTPPEVGQIVFLIRELVTGVIQE